MLPEPIPAVQLAMEGSRWADELERIRRIFVHDNIVLQRGRREPDRSSPLERRILDEVDGKMPLGELYNEVRGSYFRFLQGAYRLAVAEALDITEVGDQADSHSTELRLADLLIEQVTEEQAVFLRHHLAVPFDALERCVPVWVRSPSEDEEARMSETVRAFYARIDGETDLRALFGGERSEEGGRQMDRIVLQLRKGALALLPAPLSALEADAAKAGVEPRQRWWTAAPGGSDGLSEARRRARPPRARDGSFRCRDPLQRCAARRRQRTSASPAAASAATAIAAGSQPGQTLTRAVARREPVFTMISCQPAASAGGRARSSETSPEVSKRPMLAPSTASCTASGRPARTPDGPHLDHQIGAREERRPDRDRERRLCRRSGRDRLQRQREPGGRAERESGAPHFAAVASSATFGAGRCSARRSLPSISSASSGLSRRNCLAFSRPWPRRTSP